MKEFKFRKTVNICLETNRRGHFEYDIKGSDYKIDTCGDYADIRISINGALIPDKDMDVLECWLDVQAADESEKSMVAKYNGFDLEKLETKFSALMKKMKRGKHCLAIEDIKHSKKNNDVKFLESLK